MQDMLIEICNPKFFLPETLQASYPSHLHIDILKRAQASNEIKCYIFLIIKLLSQRRGNGTRMIMTIFSVLKAKGSCGVHLEMAASNARALRFYFKLGFTKLDFSDKELTDDVLILVKAI